MPSYRIEPADRLGHHFIVTMTLKAPAAEQGLSLPVWIPGSYLVREFARHLSDLKAHQGSREVRLQQLDKSRWVAHCSGSAALQVSYRVYAFDTSVRAAFVDVDRGFFNGTGLCLRADGHEAMPHQIELAGLPREWDVATAMTALPGRGRVYEAADYDELVDHPFELGPFWRGSFEARGVPHEFIVAGAPPAFDGERLLADTKAICEAQIVLWHGRGAKVRPPFERYVFLLNGAKVRPPFERYVFLLNTVEDGRGGLEHRASTALLAPRRCLPRPGVSAVTDAYVDLLGLISHEYFHAWNVKRMRPIDFAQIDYARENYTELLWFFEGFTSYYDDLMLLRCGAIDAPRYLQLLTKTINGVLATPGRFVQSAARASFDAWIKLYRPDENSPNASVSYYAKGALIGLALDLSLRQVGSSLDAIMRTLWRATDGGPLAEAQVLQAVEDVAGRAVGRELGQWVHGTLDPPLQRLLEGAGVSVHQEPTGLAAGLGLRLSEGPVSGVQVKSVLADSAAARAGVSAGDEILAVDGWRIRRLDDALQWSSRDRPMELLLVRDQRLRPAIVEPDSLSPLRQQWRLGLATSASAQALTRRRAWLGC